MARDERNAFQAMTPARLFRLHAAVFGGWAVLCLFLMACSDASGDYYYFRFFAVAFLLASSVIVVIGYLAIRRAWKGEPPSEVKDSLLPIVIIAALGWVIWSIAHYLTP